MKSAKIKIFLFLVLVAVIVMTHQVATGTISIKELSPWVMALSAITLAFTLTAYILVPLLSMLRNASKDSEPAVDEEELHHGNGEKKMVYTFLVCVLLCGSLFWLFTPKVATILSVIFGIGLFLKYTFNRRDRRAAGVVTEQYH